MSADGVLRRRGRPPVRWTVLAAVSSGGAVGSLARWALQEPFPHRRGGFPWATFGINVGGCLLIGVLMVLVTQVWTAQRLLRPFLGVGVLGGFTSFSAYAVDTQQAMAAGAQVTAAAYLAGTLVAALAAAWLGTVVTAHAVRPRGGRGRER